MGQFFRKKGFISVLIAATLGLLTLTIMFGAYFVYQLDQEMLLKMEQKKMLQPTVFYSRAPSWKKGDFIPLAEVVHPLQNTLRSREKGLSLFAGDYRLLTGSDCQEVLPESLPSELLNDDQCLQIFWSAGESELFQSPWLETLWTGADNQIKGIYDGVSLSERVEFVLKPQVMAQYLGEEPILFKETPLNQIPVDCLNAIIAIEDARFLEHKGISFIGILRAVAVNLIKGRKAQGGSTLTQQMVKNYFLTPEKTLKRKLVEFVMSLLIEVRFDKDLILETYLNIIYMGQQGPYQIRGYGAASKHYFQKNLNQINLSQCSLLAAIVNSPGQYDPFKKPEKAKERRDFVLQKMVEQKFITAKEKDRAASEPLPRDENIHLYSTLPYFLQAVMEQAKKLGVDDFAGYRIFTTLDLDLQEAAQTAVVSNLENLESSRAPLKKLMASQKTRLEGALVSVDVASGKVRSLVGGRSYKTTQFNRILMAKRQVGSTFKPFVYLAALHSGQDRLDPLMELKDEPFTHTYGRQKWTPKNYDKSYFGMVPMYFGLKESLNLSTSHLALDIGLDKVADMAHELGIESPLPEVPSMSLGALELSPLELLQAYLTIANFGKHRSITFIESLYEPNGEKVWSEDERALTEKVDTEPVEVLVGMMKQVSKTGTAQKITESGFEKTVAGKTGTTNDYKDSWFVGFTPDVLTLSWTGFDNNTSTGLTGASGALPAWLSYMNKATKFNANRDFQWTEGVESRTILTADLISKGFWGNKPANEPEEVELIFTKD